jgi:sortase A
MTAWFATLAALLSTMGAAPTPPHYAHDQKAGVIIIPAIHVRAPIHQGTAHHVLDHSVGHTKRSDWPGEDGTSLFWGHNVTPMLGLPHGVFHNINRLRRGDTIKVRMTYGTYRYTVRRHWEKEESEVADFLRRHRDGRVYLIKCFPDFSSSHRYIVLAK